MCFVQLQLFAWLMRNKVTWPFTCSHLIHCDIWWGPYDFA